MTNRTYKLTLEVAPHHTKSHRGRRVPRPLLERLLSGNWWTNAVFGNLSARDPVPQILSVSIADEDRAAFMEDAATADRGVRPAETKDRGELTGPQQVLVDAMEGPWTLVFDGIGYSLRDGDTELSVVRKTTVSSMVKKGLLDPDTLRLT